MEGTEVYVPFIKSLIFKRRMEGPFYLPFIKSLKKYKKWKVPPKKALNFSRLF